MAPRRVDRRAHVEAATAAAVVVATAGDRERRQR